MWYCLFLFTDLYCICTQVLIKNCFPQLPLPLTSSREGGEDRGLGSRTQQPQGPLTLLSSWSKELELPSLDYTWLLCIQFPGFCRIPTGLLFPHEYNTPNDPHFISIRLLPVLFPIRRPGWVFYNISDARFLHNTAPNFYSSVFIFSCECILIYCLFL